MARIKPFKGLRPLPQHVQQVTAPPYDVLSSDEARRMADGNDMSMLHVSKPEIDLPSGTNIYSEEVYRKGAENLESLRRKGVLRQDERSCYYLYRLQMGNHVQTGLVAAASVDDYLAERIKKHEFTRPDKEDDRTKHILCSKSQSGPVFCIFRTDPALMRTFDVVVGGKPEYDFEASDGIRHTLWVINDDRTIDTVTAAFASYDRIFIADGHHRSAAGARAALALREKTPGHNGNEEFNYFLTVIFPEEQLQIMAYNRVLKDVNGMSEADLLERLESIFKIEAVRELAYAEPKQPHSYGMYMSGKWRRLTAKDTSSYADDPVESLDVQFLQRNVLQPMFGIENPRTDKRIDFVGGIRGLAELQRLVDSGGFKVAFALFPTTVEQLIRVANADKVMPPKSTWFEPKLRDGMVIHLIE